MKLPSSYDEGGIQVSLCSGAQAAVASRPNTGAFPLTPEAMCVIPPTMFCRAT